MLHQGTHTCGSCGAAFKWHVNIRTKSELLSCTFVPFIEGSRMMTVQPGQEPPHLTTSCPHCGAPVEFDLPDASSM